MVRKKKARLPEQPGRAEATRRARILCTKSIRVYALVVAVLVLLRDCDALNYIGVARED